MSLVPGTRVGPYEILAPLGAGGMGEVFRARDPRLDRQVAIKALPAAFARDPDRLGRFEREAKLLAALSHPNIATLYGLEDAAGAPCLVLELVDGEPLSMRLARGVLSVRDTLDLGGQVAAAVEAAHARDIVHRDLKPANVMLTPARVAKVLDFGLARGGAAEGSAAPGAPRAEATIASPATAAGLVLGTTSYMSPEQARGQAVDRRTDVWGLGCILFECLAGLRAFGGDTPSDTIAKILEREPEWNALPSGTPARLRALLERCLTKDVEQRPRDVGDLRRELDSMARELSSASSPRVTATAAPSLAVLYFENLAHDPDSDYFCAGITEDILTDLSKIRGLRVASRNAVARYRGTGVDPARVAEELGVGAVLEGSVRRAGERVRITAQLVDGRSGFQLWAERFDRTLEDVFAVQEEIAAAIAAALQVTLAPSEVARIAHDRPDDVRAYDLYLKGREHYNRYDAKSFQEALALFEQAIAIDPGYARAWAGIADTCGQIIQWGLADDPEPTLRRGIDAAQRAIELDPRLPEGYKALGLCLGLAGDHDGQVRALHQAIEADPRHTPALTNLAIVTYVMGDIAGAERYARRVLELDPQEGHAHLWLAGLTELTGRYDECLRICARLRSFPEAFYQKAASALEVGVHRARGELGEVARVIRQAKEEGRFEASLRCVELILRMDLGEVTDPAGELEELAAQPDLGHQGIEALCQVSLRIGRTDVAVRLLQRPIIARATPMEIRLVHALHPLADIAPFAPRKLDTTLVWPLEAPMIDRARFRLFREVRIESGLPEGTDVR